MRFSLKRHEVSQSAGNRTHAGTPLCFYRELHTTTKPCLTHSITSQLLFTGRFLFDRRGRSARAFAAADDKSLTKRIRDCVHRFGAGWGGGQITFGALGDSFYEYLLKAWLQGGKTEPKYRDM